MTDPLLIPNNELLPAFRAANGGGKTVCLKFFIQLLEFIVCGVAFCGTNMPSDRKHGPSKPKKRRFCGNQYRKGKETCESDVVRSRESGSSQTVDCVSSHSVTDHSHDTPTRSEQKLQGQDLYKLILDCSDESDCEEENKSDSDSEGHEETYDVGVGAPEGNRIIDVKILGEMPSVRTNMTLVVLRRTKMSH